MFLSYILDLISKQGQKKDTVWEPAPMYLEEIRPEDLPPNKDAFPKSPPNKRVIIIDI